jgi:hypothetical protein
MMTFAQIVTRDWCLVLLFALAPVWNTKAEPERVTLAGHVPAVVAAGLTPKGRLPATQPLYLAIGLPLREPAALEELLRQLYDPHSTNFHKYLTLPEFTARFGPTEQDYQAVMRFAEANGLTVAGTYPNRLVLDVEGSASNVERAFHVTLRTYRHPAEARDFFAPDTEPAVDAALPVVDIQGLSDYSRPHPRLHRMDAAAAANARPQNGSAPDGSTNYFGNDFRNAYVPGTTLTGAGQRVGLFEADGFYASDITAYATAAGNGRTNIVIQTVLLDSFNGVPTTGADSGNPEVSLDIEMAMAIAPGLAEIVVFEGNPTDFIPNDILNSMLSYSNTVNNLSSSWGWSGGPSTTTDTIFKNMAAVGQSFFNASGDSDAFTTGKSSANGVDNTKLDNAPSSNPYITQVGGTTLKTGANAAYSSETVWNWNYDSNAGAYVGSSGGISSHYSIPSWQTNVSGMTNRGGSTKYRNIPDVALTADNVYVAYGNGTSGEFGGTSCAAPLWAGFLALVNQQAAANGGTNAGFINPAIYAIAATSNYLVCFHDVTTGSNTWPSSPSLFYATNGYDLCTGLGTPNGTNLINALAPFNLPYFMTEPSSQTVTNGASLTLSATAGGQSPLSYRWLFNGANLPAGANISGTASNVLSITAATTNDSGNYSLVVTNSYGSATSSVASLTVVLPPALASSSLTNSTVQCGSNNLTFAVSASGTPPLSLQWSLDGSPATGATNTSFSLTNLHLPNHTVTITVTNLYASVTSTAVVTVLDTLPPVITLNGGNPLYVELGSAFTDPGATANDLCVGVVPVSVSGRVNTNALGTNTLVYTATDGNGNTNTATRTVIVRDTTPPAILWSFTNLVLAANTNCRAAMPNVTGTNFILATDLSGALTISQIPTNTAILPLGTNVVVITVEDSSGNAAYSTNTVVVQDQTPPVILSQPQSQTNLVGSTATFSAAAAACTPLALQWYFNNAALTAQTNGTLTLSNLTLAAAGNYSVIAAASGGSSTSVVATLTVNLLSATVALASSENPSGFKDSVNFTAALTPANATGAIQFSTNGIVFDLEPLSGGAAVSTNLSSLPRGTNLVTALYSGDATYLPATNALAQVVTNHPPVAAPAFYTNTASFTLTILIANLATNWSDVDGDTVSLAAVSVSTNGITLTNTGAALVYFNSNNVADQFTCTITDGFGGANFQTVTIAPALRSSTAPLITGIVAAGNGSVTLSLGGAPGCAYVLETTTNLASSAIWQPAATNTPGTNGVWQFTETEGANFQQRFYRLKLAP